MIKLLKQLKQEMRDGMRLEIEICKRPIETEDKETFHLRLLDMDENKTVVAEISFKAIEESTVPDIVCKELITDLILQLNRITG